MYSTRATWGGRFFVVMGVLVCVLAFQLVLAQSDEPTEAGTEAEVAVGEPNWDANKRVLDDIAEWKRTNPMALSLLQRDDVLAVEGTAFVALNADDKRWPKARSLGYQQAFMNAIGEYVSLIRSRVTSRLIREQFEEDLDESELTFDPEDSVSSQLERITEKLGILGERKLDQALANSGMNEEEIARLTPAQKKTTFSDRMTRRTTIEAFGSAAGLVPIKTFEAIDNEGNTAIGVVAASSSRMRRLSTRIARGKSIAPDADRARRSIAEQLSDMSDDELVDQFGVRVYWDEQGYPVIVAFGQWGFSNEGLNKRKIARRRDFAGAQAENDARAHLVTFIRASTRFTEESTVGADVEEAFNVMPDDTVEEIDTARLADVLVKKASVTSQAELIGMATSRSWSARHPDLESQEIVGAVVTWSPAAEKAVRAAVRDDEPPEPPARQERSAPRGTSTRQSREDMDSSDF